MRPIKDGLLGACKIGGQRQQSTGIIVVQNRQNKHSDSTNAHGCTESPNSNNQTLLLPTNPDSLHASSTSETNITCVSYLRIPETI